MAKIKLAIPSVAKNIEQLIFAYFARGCVKWHTTRKNCLVVSYQVKHKNTTWSNNSTPLTMKSHNICKGFLPREPCLSYRVQGFYWGLTKYACLPEWPAMYDTRTTGPKQESQKSCFAQSNKLIIHSSILSYTKLPYQLVIQGTSQG